MLRSKDAMDSTVSKQIRKRPGYSKQAYVRLMIESAEDREARLQQRCDQLRRGVNNIPWKASPNGS